MIGRRLIPWLVVITVSLVGCEEQVSPPPPFGGSGGGTGNVGGRPPTGGSGGGGTGGVGGSAGSGGTGGASGMSGAGGASGMSGAGGEGGMSGTGGGSAGTGGSGFLGDACLNMNDADIIQMASPNLRQESAQCGDQCATLTGQDFIDCFEPCFALEVPGLTTECSACYLDLAVCAGDDCNAICEASPDACGPGCLGAVDDQPCANYLPCIDALNNCAGRPSLDCPDDV